MGTHKCEKLMRFENLIDIYMIMSSSLFCEITHIRNLLYNNNYLDISHNTVPIILVSYNHQTYIK